MASILASALGVVIIGFLFNLAEVLALTGYFVLFKPGGLGDALLIAYSLIGLLSFVLGIYFGLRAYNHKNVWYDVFCPTKAAILISVGLSLALVFLSLALSGKNAFSSSYTLESMALIFALPLSLVGYTISFYPFSALCVFLYHSNKKTYFKHSKAIIILLIIVMNPLFIVWETGMGAIYRQGIINEPCGIKIVAYSEPSAARENGVPLNETIIGVDDKKIMSINDLKEYLESYTSSDGLRLKTTSGTYEFTPLFLDGRYVIGLDLAQEICKRSLTN